jgi:hypothetical protein
MDSYSRRQYNNELRKHRGKAEQLAEQILAIMEPLRAKLADNTREVNPEDARKVAELAADLAIRIAKIEVLSDIRPAYVPEGDPVTPVGPVRVVSDAAAEEEA